MNRKVTFLYVLYLYHLTSIALSELLKKILDFPCVIVSLKSYDEILPAMHTLIFTCPSAILKIFTCPGQYIGQPLMSGLGIIGPDDTRSPARDGFNQSKPHSSNILKILIGLHRFNIKIQGRLLRHELNKDSIW